MIVFSVSVLILLIPTNSYAGSSVSVQCGDMIGGTSQALDGAGNPASTNPGAIVLISQSDGSQTLIGDPTAAGSLPGLDFDGAGMLWGVNNIAPGGALSNPTSFLIKINPNTGALISSVAITTVVAGVPVSIQDLGVDPVTDVLFGTTHPLDTGIGSSSLVTIDKATGFVTLKGLQGALSNIDEGLALDFAPDGTLYVTKIVGGVLTIVNPGDASQIGASVGIGVAPPGLGVKDDGTIFVSQAPGSPASIIHTVNPSDGSTTLIGDGVDDHIVDLTFVVCPTGGESIGGELLSIDSTALMLAGLQSSAVWMIPTLVGLAGAGFYLIKFRTTKE